MQKILYCASTASHILNFHLPYLQFFKEQGWQVDVAVPEKAEIPYADNVIELPMEKSLLAVGNLRAVQITKQLLADNEYELISTHTALAGAIIRLAVKLLGKQMKQGKIVHTSHGYFFSWESDPAGWSYLWAEKLLAPVTDVLMVMNRADYGLAVRHKLCRNIVPIPGMGIDLAKFSRVGKEDKKSLKLKAGFNPDDFLLVYAAEMSKRKNQGELIRAFALAAAQEPSLKLVLAGEGALKDQYQEMAHECGFGERILFPGQVSAMVNLYEMCDAAVSTSRSEGLPFNVMEAMACGLPVIASRIKGHTDLLSWSDGFQDSLLYAPGDEQTLAGMLLNLCRDEKLREKAGDENRIKVRHYELEMVRPVVIEGYGELLQ